MEGAQSAWTPPREFEEYRLIKALGRGAMGEVYLAHDTLLERAVAVKFISGEPDDSDRERFFIEARTIARLSHPNVVTIFRVGEVRRRPFIVTELIRGRSLADLARPLGSSEVLRLGTALARGLAAAHRHGVLHRDIKPANAMISDEGEVKLLDFGVAKLIDPQPDHPPQQATAVDSSSAATASTSLTSRSRTGLIVGTPLYLAPELWRGEPATRRSDVYSLGCLLYELAVGKPPLFGNSFVQLPDASQQPLRSLIEAAPGVDPRLAEVVDRCLLVDPAARYESGDALREALERASIVLVPGALQLPPGNPYRGLMPFEAEHRALFFGRGAEARAILDRLRFEPAVLVAGDSGVGKSSLCRAGVLPRLGEAGPEDGKGWRTICLVPGRRPLTALAAAIAPLLDVEEESLLAELRADPAALGLAVRKRRRGRVLLFIDQLEELLTLSDPTEASTLSEVLGASVERDSGLGFLGTARADFLARLALLPSFGELVPRMLFFLKPLSSSGLREAIVGPAHALGARFESEAMVDALVRSAEQAAGGLPPLQFALAELWEAREENRNLLSEAALGALGGVDGALARHADGVIAGLPAHERAIARRILTDLVSGEGTRARRSSNELVALDRSSGQAVLETLVRGRLLYARDAEEGEDGTYEIAHEALLTNWDTLRSWLTKDAERQRARRRVEGAAAEWDRLGRAAEALWGERQLLEVGDLDEDLAERERAFLQRSRIAVRLRKLRRYAVWIGAPLALAGIYAGVQVDKKWEVDRQVARHVANAERALGEAHLANARVEEERRLAFARFDEGDLAGGNRIWEGVLGLLAEVDTAQAKAGQALEAALLLDRRRSVRARFADLLYEEALLAERDHRPKERDERLLRLAAYDEDERRLKEWQAPARVTLSSEPAGAQVWCARFDESRRLGAAQLLGETPLEGKELSPGSYLFTLNLRDRAPVRYPLLLGRKEDFRSHVVVPRRVPDGWVYIPRGRFLFGSADDEGVRGFLAAPALHQVETGAYLIGRTEVTFGDWIRFLRALPPAERERRRPRVGDVFGAVELTELPDEKWRLLLRPTAESHTAKSGELFRYPRRKLRAEQDWLHFPVSGISFNDAEAFAAWLDRSGQVPGARLCDEREWERAARGADDRRYPHGDRLSVDDANFDLTYGRESFGPDEVGTHPLSDSPFGVSDLAGNVWELTRSAMRTEKIITRGGSFYHDAISAHSANRAPSEEMGRSAVVGLRLCADAARE